MNWYISIILFIPIVLGAVSPDPCENGGIMEPTEGICFHFLNITQTFDDAFSVCKSFYSFPASIMNAFQRSFVTTFYKDYFNGDFFIGLKLAQDETVWRWMDRQPLNYSNWATGYPQNDPNKRCVIIQVSDGKWINVACNEQKRFTVCQSIPKIFHDHCINPSVDMNNKCNQMINSLQSYSDAEKICSVFGSKLLSISNVDEVTKLQGYLNHIAKRPFSGADYYIGLSDPQKTGNFIWSDGSTLSYANWASGYPDSNRNNYCVAAKLSDGTWYNTDCSLKKYFICQQPFARSTAREPCPDTQTWGPGPQFGENCTRPTDPNNYPPSALELWFTKEMYNDLFYHANLAWGPHPCWPFSYESFVMAARYFPDFGTTSPDNGFTSNENYRRDVAAFFAHAIQETGENYEFFFSVLSKEDARECFYRGGFFNWFEGGPASGYLYPKYGYDPADGTLCQAGLYCDAELEASYYYPCHKTNGCYIGRGAIQISWNYNYGPFSEFLNSKGVNVDLLTNPNDVMTKMDPPLAVMASLWFYMTPQPPKPSMHDIVLGKWNAGAKNTAAGYSGAIFGPTSQVINNECGGESASEPGGGGENRRIKSFRWFSEHFGFRLEADSLLSCRGMPEGLLQMQYNACYHPDPTKMESTGPCECIPIHAGGIMFYFDPEYYPEYTYMNEPNRKRCVQSIYDNAAIYGLSTTSECLKHPPEYVKIKN